MIFLRIIGFVQRRSAQDKENQHLFCRSEVRTSAELTQYIMVIRLIMRRTMDSIFENFLSFYSDEINRYNLTVFFPFSLHFKIKNYF